MYSVTLPPISSNLNEALKINKKIVEVFLKNTNLYQITSGLLNSISVKNISLTDFIKKKSLSKKSKLYLKNKKASNLSSTLLNKSK